MASDAYGIRVIFFKNSRRNTFHLYRERNIIRMMAGAISKGMEYGWKSN